MSLPLLTGRGGGATTAATNQDQASPQLARFRGNGNLLTKVILLVTDPGPRSAVYKIGPDKVRGSSFGQSLVAGDVAREAIALSVKAIKLSYRPTKPDGSLETPSTRAAAALRSSGLPSA